MTPRIATQFTVSFMNHPEALGRVAQALAREGINMSGAMTGGLGGPSVFRFVAERPSGVRERLESDGCAVEESQVCCVEIPDRPGELERVSRLLLDQGISIHHMYGTSRGEGSPVTVVLSVSDPKKAVFVLLRSQFEASAPCRRPLMAGPSPA